MVDLARNPESINIRRFADMLNELTKLLGSFGGMLKMAFADIKQKSNILDNNLTEWLNRTKVA